jgi:CRP-like cAMP-binding protein
LELANGEMFRLRTVGPGAIVGAAEMLGDVHVHDASIVTEQPATLYRLSNSDFQRMKEESPQVALAFQDFLIAFLAARVSRGVRLIQDLMEIEE